MNTNLSSRLQLPSLTSPLSPPCRFYKTLRYKNYKYRIREQQSSPVKNYLHDELHKLEEIIYSRQKGRQELEEVNKEGKANGILLERN
jgi:hypothetical protein